MLERLQKTIARAGVASRRHAEQLILSGQVQVNGKMVSELGTKADPERDAIKVAGKLLRFPVAKVYLVLHKPPGSVSTMSDPEGRRTLQNFLHGVGTRVFPAGRLEYHASGLMLLTSDGELAARVLQASRRGLPQTFWIKLKGQPGEGQLGEAARAAGARMHRLSRGPNPWYEVTLADARRDVLRKRLAQAGHRVEKVKRVKLDGLELGDLPPGEYRYLTASEVAALERAAARVLQSSEIRGRKPGDGSTMISPQRTKPSRVLNRESRAAR